MNLKHGMSRGKSAEYRAWQGMKSRCYKQSDDSYTKYGGRGIEVCERWRDDFLVFYADMGAKPTPLHSLDRIDNDGDYSPGNCRWADKATQSRNVRPRNQFGIAGMSVQPNGKFRVFINVNNKCYALGTTDNFFEACCKRKSAENRYWSETRNI